MFLRYSSFAFLKNDEKIEYGRWPIPINAIFNALAPYIFINAFVLIFLPIFIGKLSIIRDIYASTFFRPLARITYSVAVVEGLALYFVFFSQQQRTYFDHKNILFIYFALVLNVYLISFIVSLMFEFPFRTMAKVVFSPTKKTLRLKNDLAKELNTNNIENIFNETEEDDLPESMSNRITYE